MGLSAARRNMATVDILVSQVLKGAQSQGAKTSKTYLDDLNIKPCQSCGVDPYPKYCIFDDDMKKTYNMLQSCDAMVLGSPVYFDTVSAQTKLVIDRCNCLMPYVKHKDGTYGFKRRMKKCKKGVFIAVAGTDQEFHTILTTVKGFFTWANIEMLESILYSHDDDILRGVESDEERMSQAFKAGVQLAHALSK